MPDIPRSFEETSLGRSLSRAELDDHEQSVGEAGEGEALSVLEDPRAPETLRSGSRPGKKRVKAAQEIGTGDEDPQTLLSSG